jgi:hypothetical protein
LGKTVEDLKDSTRSRRLNLGQVIRRDINAPPIKPAARMLKGQAKTAQPKTRQAASRTQTARAASDSTPFQSSSRVWPDQHTLVPELPDATAARGGQCMHK